MLVQNSKFNVGDIINLKLISGDEVVGELISQDQSFYELRNPCLIVTSPDGIGLIQAMFGLDPSSETLTYQKQHVITTCKTHIKMQDHYNIVTTS